LTGEIMTFDKKKYDQQFQKENYDRIALNVKKGEKEKIKKIAILKGYSGITEYICSLIYNDINNFSMGGGTTDNQSKD